jgi:hypothetical protein
VRWINGGGGGEVKISGCQSGATPTEGAGGSGVVGRGCRLNHRQSVGPKGGKLPKTHGQEAGDGKENPSRRQRHQTRGKRLQGSHAQHTTGHSIRQSLNLVSLSPTCNANDHVYAKCMYGRYCSIMQPPPTGDAYT